MTEVFPFTRTERQVGELRRYCGLWSAGAVRFWGFDDVLAALSRSGSLGFFAAAREDAPWEGMLLADVGPFTADLLYVFVEPAYRGKRIGRALMERLRADLAARPQLEAIFLEVRATNAPARALYESLGMMETGRRKAYYPDGEDALVYKQELR